MISIQRGLVLLSTVGAITLSMVAHDPADVRSADSPPDPKALYSASEPEHYLSVEEYQWIRPGLQITVESVEIPADRHPVVTLSYADDLGQPLDRHGVLTPGAVSFSFILAWYDGDERDYTAYTTRVQTSPITGDSAVQASADSGGTVEDLGTGRIRYTFGTELPADFPASKTHSLGIYASRNLQDLVEKTYYDNVVYDWVPAGGAVDQEWAAMDDATCNSCHEQLAFHGGSRRDVKLCVLCHNTGEIDPDTGNSVDMKVMIHKIHAGENLPSVQAGMPYQIIGFRQSVHDYSNVAYPQELRNCVRCHPADSPEGHIWFTRPARDTCGSCHDDIVWETGENHPIPQLDDDACANCHPPQGDREFDISVMGAHTIPTRSEQLAGLNMEILEVTGAGPGMTPTVTFTLTNGDGSPVDPASLDQLRLQVGGPTTDYARYFTENIVDPVPSGNAWVFTMTTPLPDDAMGSWGFSADVYRNVIIDDGSADGLQVREAAFNPIAFAAVTDSMPVPRREVVSLEKCNVCHDVLSLHGGQRFAIESCLICHNPLETDVDVRPADAGQPESVHFKWLIHRIHTGHLLEDPFVVYGFRGSVHDYSHVGYPGDLRTCEGCHLPGTYGVPVPDGSLPTSTADRDFISPMPPASAACLACHDSVDAAAHAYTNTAPFGESCAACHGDNREFSVMKVHAH